MIKKSLTSSKWSRKVTIAKEYNESLWALLCQGWTNRFDHTWPYYIQRKISWINYSYIIFSTSANIEMATDEMVIILSITKSIYSVIPKTVKKFGYLIVL